VKGVPGRCCRRSMPSGASGVPVLVVGDGSTTQTFDRQSPPCISSWDGVAGNGGADVVRRECTDVPHRHPGRVCVGLQPYADFLNHHYELTGVIAFVPLGVATTAAGRARRAERVVSR